MSEQTTGSASTWNVDCTYPLRSQDTKDRTKENTNPKAGAVGKNTGEGLNTGDIVADVNNVGSQKDINTNQNDTEQAYLS